MKENKAYIAQEIQVAVRSFNELISGLQADQFEQSIEGKWSAGQDLAHLVKTAQIIGYSFILPKSLLKVLFGLSNRPSRSAEDLYNKYSENLSKGGKAPAAFIPKKIKHCEQKRLIHQHEQYGNLLVKRLNRFSESELDLYVMPHPLIGKVTLREMFCFSYLHSNHHLKTLKEKLARR